LIYEYFDDTESTMLIAERYISEKKYAEDFVIVAETQTKGRGRKGNEWMSPKGGLWFSFVMNHVSLQKSFTLYVGYCVVKALNEIYEVCFKLKWPNDVYFEEKKVCGLICSQFSQVNKTMIGIGINTNVPTLPENAPSYAGSLQEILGVTIDNKACLDSIVNNIYSGLNDFERNGISVFYDFYKENDLLADKKINVSSGNEEYIGQYMGIDEDGTLLMRCENEDLKKIYSGSVEIL